jgi:rubrerythrin
MEKKTLESLINVAIAREEAAYSFYKELQQKIDDKEVYETLEFLAGEEQKHREFLVGYKEGRLGADALQMSDAVDYKIAEHLEAPDPDADMESKDVYLVAANRELQSHNFYKALADIHPDGEAREVLLKMASQELKHKEKVEYLYANTAFPQTAGG